VLRVRDCFSRKLLRNDIGKGNDPSPLRYDGQADRGAMTELGIGVLRSREK